MCMSVSVCPRAYLRNDTSNLHQLLCTLVTRGRGSVFLWGVVIRYVLPVYG